MTGQRRRERMNVRRRAPTSGRMPILLALLLSLAMMATTRTTVALDPTEQNPVKDKTNSLSRKDRKELNKKKLEEYKRLKEEGNVEVGHSLEAAKLRDYQLRKKKRKGLLRKKEADLASVLFPGVTPEVYKPAEEVLMFTDLVNSKKTQVPFEYYDLPGCQEPIKSKSRDKRQHKRKNLGNRLQGVEHKPAPYPLRVKRNEGCTPLCQVNIKPKKINWTRKLVERQYRIHMTLDSLPVLMRSEQLNYAVRGYPVGFMAPPSYTGLKEDKFFLYNHLKFSVNYRELEDGNVHIIGFDVHPVSIAHDIPEKSENMVVNSCNADNAPEVVNDSKTYLALENNNGGDMQVIYSYEVEWVESELNWADRWDVYLIGSPDDDIHSFAIVNSLMIVLFMTGAIATIMIRTLRKDIAGYNEMHSLEEAQDETGWKLVHGDVFRPPQTHPILFSVLVGTGAQIGSAFFLTMLCSIVGLINPMRKGQTLTAILVLYVLCGSISGYVSARMYKFADAKAWKQTTILTAGLLPGVLVALFMVLNVFLRFANAATAINFVTLLCILALWICVSTPLVFVGSFFGFRAPKIEVPTKTNQISRYIPETPWYATPPTSLILGGILPFGSVCIELFFIMSALWLHQIYYMMGFLLAVLLILGATCAEVSIVMCYLQLCAEDHRWWWKSFGNCASAGGYLLLYSLWFLVSRLDLVGVLPVIVYLTYMSMISVCFALFCGSVGVLCSFWFTRTIYGALKVD